MGRDIPPAAHRPRERQRTGHTDKAETTEREREESNTVCVCVCACVRTERERRHNLQRAFGSSVIVTASAARPMALFLRTQRTETARSSAAIYPLPLCKASEAPRKNSARNGRKTERHEEHTCLTTCSNVSLSLSPLHLLPAPSFPSPPAAAASACAGHCGRWPGRRVCCAEGGGEEPREKGPEAAHHTRLTTPPKDVASRLAQSLSRSLSLSLPQSISLSTLSTPPLSPSSS